MRVVLPREPDAAVHLHVQVGAQVGRGAGEGRGDRRGVRALVATGRRRAAASQTAAVASSVATAMLAQWCLTAWYIAIGRPNCSRTLAYSAAASVHSRAMPTASAERRSLARSTSTGRAPARTVAVAPSSVTRPDRRVGSRFAGTSIFTPPPATSTITTSSPAGTTITSARPAPRTVPASPDAAPSRTSTAPPRPIPALRVPSARPGRSAPFVSSSPAASSTRAGDDRRHERARGERATELLDHDDELLHPRARTAVRLAHVEAEPAEAGDVLPEVGARLVRGFEQRARGAAGVALAEEVGRGVGERPMVVSDRNRHTAGDRTGVSETVRRPPIGGASSGKQCPWVRST